VFLRTSLVAFLFCGYPLAPAAASGYWLEARAAGPGEVAIRDAMRTSAFGGPEAKATALLALADGSPASPASALARLAAGLEFLDAGRYDAALAALRHTDSVASLLADHAFYGVARALDAQQGVGAGVAYLAVAEHWPDGPLTCPALFRAAELFDAGSDVARALAVGQRTLSACPGQQARALLEIGRLHEKLRDPKAAAASYDRIESDFASAPQARAAEARLRALQPLLPPRTPAERDSRELARALALFEAGEFKATLPRLRALKLRPLPAAEADLVRLKLGRTYLRLKRTRDAEAELRAVSPGSPHAAEAAFYLARSTAARTRRPDAYEAVVSGFPATPWAEEALLALANHFQKDALDREALPYYRRLLAEHPDGRYADRAAWRVGWGDFRAGRFADAERVLEDTARRRPVSSVTPGLLYWAGRARQAQGDTAGARALILEVVSRFKNSYHGMRARDALSRLPRGPQPVASPPVAAPTAGLPEPQLTRIRQLLLIDRLDEAYAELGALPASTLVRATQALIDHRRGRLRPAIVSMKRAYPEWVSEAGDGLPDQAWRILYPLEYGQLLRQKAAAEGLDAALIAALICQESTFDAGAVSVAGARGLMQVIPATGRMLARQLGVRYRTGDLLNPGTSLEFGTRYLRQMFERFGGRVERVLAAYNAGPHRVDAWTAGRPDISDEEFVESIPFTETRHYVMTVLAGQEQYRRLYGLGPAEATPQGAGSR